MYNYQSGIDKHRGMIAVGYIFLLNATVVRQTIINIMIIIVVYNLNVQTAHGECILFIVYYRMKYDP